MRKFVNPFKYLTKKNSVIFVLLNIINTISFFITFIPDSFIVRVISAVILLVTTLALFLYITYLQAVITRNETSWVFKSNHEYQSDCDDCDNYDDDDDDDEEYDDDMDEDMEEAIDDDYNDDNEEENNDKVD